MPAKKAVRRNLRGGAGFTDLPQVLMQAVASRTNGSDLAAFAMSNPDANRLARSMRETAMDSVRRALGHAKWQIKHPFARAIQISKTLTLPSSAMQVLGATSGTASSPVEATATIAKHNGAVEVIMDLFDNGALVASASFSSDGPLNMQQTRGDKVVVSAFIRVIIEDAIRNGLSDIFGPVPMVAGGFGWRMVRGTHRRS
jgi:hypothetical protein